MSNPGLFLIIRADSIYLPLRNSFVLTFPCPTLRTSEYGYLPKSIAGQRLFYVGSALGKHILNKTEWLFTTDRCRDLFEKPTAAPDRGGLSFLPKPLVRV